MKTNKAKLNLLMRPAAVGIITSRHIACVNLTKCLKSKAIVIGSARSSGNQHPHGATVSEMPGPGM